MTKRVELGIISCESHGTTLWQYDVICAACGAFYQTQVAAYPRYAPVTCPCGVRLMPDPKNHAAEFSARVLCRKCFLGLCDQASAASTASCT